MKVSRASKNNSNFINSSKLNLFFMSTTPILCKTRSTPPCNRVIPDIQYSMSIRRKNSFLVKKLPRFSLLESKGAKILFR